MPTVHFAIAWKGASWADADSVPLMVAQTMLGAWDKNAGAKAHMSSGAQQRSSLPSCVCFGAAAPHLRCPQTSWCAVAAQASRLGALRADAGPYPFVPGQQGWRRRFAANDLAESYMAFNTNYLDTGLFGVYACAKKGQPLDDLAWCVLLLRPSDMMLSDCHCSHCRCRARPGQDV